MGEIVIAGEKDVAGYTGIHVSQPVYVGLVRSGEKQDLPVKACRFSCYRGGGFVSITPLQVDGMPHMPVLLNYSVLDGSLNSVRGSVAHLLIKLFAELGCRDEFLYSWCAHATTLSVNHLASGMGQYRLTDWFWPTISRPYIVARMTRTAD